MNGCAPWKREAIPLRPRQSRDRRRSRLLSERSSDVDQCGLRAFDRVLITVVGFKPARRLVELLARDTQRVGDRLEHARRGLVEAALDLTQIGIRDMREVGELPK